MSKLFPESWINSALGAIHDIYVLRAIHDIYVLRTIPFTQALGKFGRDYSLHYLEKSSFVIIMPAIFFKCCSIIVMFVQCYVSIKFE